LETMCNTQEFYDDFTCMFFLFMFPVSKLDVCDKLIFQIHLHHVQLFSSFYLFYFLCSTMSPGYLTNLLNRGTKDVLVFHKNYETQNEVTELSPMNDLNSQPKPKGRSKKINEVEDNLLISSYINVSKDAVLENSS
jgi:hypothetical protein